MVHKSNQLHALETKDQPLMAYVIWRNHLDSKPVLTEQPIIRAYDMMTYGIAFNYSVG